MTGVIHIGLTDFQRYRKKLQKKLIMQKANWQILSIWLGHCMCAMTKWYVKPGFLNVCCQW